MTTTDAESNWQSSINDWFEPEDVEENAGFDESRWHMHGPLSWRGVESDVAESLEGDNLDERTDDKSKEPLDEEEQADVTQWLGSAWERQLMTRHTNAVKSWQVRFLL